MSQRLYKLKTAFSNKIVQVWCFREDFYGEYDLDCFLLVTNEAKAKNRQEFEPLMFEANQMSNHRTQTIEFTIRSEIADWFKKLINERFGSDLQLRYLSNEHFDVHTHVEITASESQIKEMMEFIGNTSESLQYKLPWLNGNIYYHHYDKSDFIKKKLTDIKVEANFTETIYRIIGCDSTIFSFRPDLDEAEKKEIDEMFKSLPDTYSHFLTYPKIKDSKAQRQSSFHLARNILMGYHGAYLHHLQLEDVLSLEIANTGQGTGAGSHLHHDIQKYLRCKYTELYDGTHDRDLQQFKINEVLRYFIQKYHKNSNLIYVPNILTADEIQYLSKSYNNDIVCNKLVHIDFKSENALESVDFCLIYHFDPKHLYFLNYNMKYASENHAINFNVDDSLDPLKCSTDFSNLVIKSQNNCSPQKTNSVLKCVVEHFNALENISFLILYEFDLKHVSRQILSSLLRMMGQGWLQFHKMSFNYETLSGILTQSAKNSISFIKCHIALDNFKLIPINSQQSNCLFQDMDIDLNTLYMLSNLEYMSVVNCRILTTSWDVPIKMEISDYISFEHTHFDITTLILLLDGLQSVTNILFNSCVLTSGVPVKKRYSIHLNKIQFTNMIFKVQAFLEIFEKCKIKSHMNFINCHFLLEDNESYKFLLEPVNIDFDNIKFDERTLLTLLGSLNNESSVWINNCCVSRSDDNFSVTKIIQASYVHFKNCRLETNILLNILGKISKDTLVVIDCCNVMRSSEVDPTLSTNLSEMWVVFKNMTIESQLAGPILRTNSKITFDNCCLRFMTELSDTSIQSTVYFQNMRFQSPAQLNSLDRFSTTSILWFVNCHFEFTNLEIANIVIQPQLIYFEKTSFDLEVLLKVMERVSEYTTVFIDGCVILSIAPMLHTLPIKIRTVHIRNMSLQIKTILCILKGFSNLKFLYFYNIRMLCSNPTELPDIKINPSKLSFSDMNIDLTILQTLVHKCSKLWHVSVNNCTIKSSSMLRTRLNISRLIFENTTYSPDVLRLIQSLNVTCAVSYAGQLSNQAIIEICTKSSVSGTRLILDDQHFTSSFYYELFLEYFCSKGINFEVDTNAEYDLPTDIIPCKKSDTDNTDGLVRRRLETRRWNKMKIKVVEVNDGTVKLEFLRNGKVIDLFFVLNGLSHDSDECFVDYY